MRKANLVKELNRPKTKDRSDIKNDHRRGRARSGTPVKAPSAFKTERKRSRSRSYSRSDDEAFKYEEDEPEIEEHNPVSIVVMSDADVYRREPTPSNDNEE